ncbi:MAG TPA: hypothetical protein VL403_11290 [Candidatus Kryptonia bacterium]|nr:hypothetical protein [Candidatus Kryptonia bacterium]
MAVVATLFGCGTLSYKTGSTAGDYQAASDRCRKQGHAEGSDFERCMNEQGWMVKQFGAPPAPSDAKNSNPAETPPPESQSSPTAHDTAPSSSPSSAPSAGDPIDVKNWFKLGGTAEEFAAARRRCAAKLGGAESADAESQPVTGEMLDCLRNEGWRAF